MNDKKTKIAKRYMKIGFMIRMSIIAVMAVVLAVSFSDEKENFTRVATGSDIAFVIAGFVFDTIMALLWIYPSDATDFHFVFYIVHCCLYFCINSFFYVLYAAECANASPLGAIPVAFYIWVIGLIPIIFYGIGVITLYAYEKAREKAYPQSGRP